MMPSIFRALAIRVPGFKKESNSFNKLLEDGKNERRVADHVRISRTHSVGLPNYIEGRYRIVRRTESGGESEDATRGFDPFCITCPETTGFDPLTQREVLAWQGTGLPQDFQCLLYD